jgi:AcrR family transcriptional regulator
MATARKMSVAPDRERILAAARECFGEARYAAASTHMVASTPPIRP